MSASTHEFIGCYGDVRRTDLESFCWTDETGGMPSDTPSLALPLMGLAL